MIMKCALGLCLLLSGVSAAAAQDTASVAQGWQLLAAGDAVRAAERARAALAEAPRSIAALALAVEVDIARAGAGGGLDVYEQWLGQRTLEEPAVLRRIARAVLQAAQTGDHAEARMRALTLLAADGDGRAVAMLGKAASSDGQAEARALAAAGQPDGVKALIARLPDATRGAAILTIDALGRSGSEAAVEPLARRLSDPSPEIRGAAAEAIGRIGGASAAGRLKPLLSDPSMHVKVKAASALYAMNDDSGARIFEELLAAAQDSTAGRLVAAEAMASRPDAAWLALVRGLLQAQEPHVRLAAARLLAPHDPAAARAEFESLKGDSNPAIRDEAGRASASREGDLSQLRRMFRSHDPLTRVNAAGTIFELTR